MLNPHPWSGFEGTARADPFQILLAEHTLLRQQISRAVEAAHDRDEGESLHDALEGLLASIKLHLRREGVALYPVCERLFGGKDGATSVLRDDHAAIRRQVAALARGGVVEPEAAVSRVEALRLQVEDHFAKEERVLFPLVAALLSGTESTALARRLRATSRVAGGERV